MLRSAILLVALAGCGRCNFGSDAIDVIDDKDAEVFACITQVSAGASHTCALRGNGTVQCWGRNNLGQLGDGTFGMSPLPVTVTESAGGAPFANVTQISMGAEDNSCARRSDGTAWCWGWNSQGQLGDGTIMNRPSPVQVMAAPGVPLDEVAEVVTGEEHSCARKTDGTVWCWGANASGQLGTGGSPASSLTPRQVLVDAVTPLVGVRGLALGAYHTLAWGAGGQLYGWGENTGGELGIGSNFDAPYATIVMISGVVSASAGCCHSCITTGTGLSYCSGRNVNGELGDGTQNPRNMPVQVLATPNGSPFLLAQIAAGDSHTCGRRDDASVWCWGDNSNGEVGTGSSSARILSPARVMLDSAATYVLAGNNHVCAAHADGMSCWGNNTGGQLGNGVFSTSNVPVPVSLICP